MLKTLIEVPPKEVRVSSTGFQEGVFSFFFLSEGHFPNFWVFSGGLFLHQSKPNASKLGFVLGFPACLECF